MNRARIGAKVERELRKMLEAQGAQVIRSAASKGPWDLIAVWPREIRLIQVKRVDKVTPGRAARAEKEVRQTNPRFESVLVSKEYYFRIKRKGWERQVIRDWVAMYDVKTTPGTTF